MRVIVLVAILLLAQNAAAGKPCERLAELVTQTLEWIRYDYSFGQLTRLTSIEMERIRDEGLEQTGYDIFSADDREKVICRVFDFKKLKDVADFLEELPGVKAQGGVPYSVLCRDYKAMLDYRERGLVNELEINLVKTMSHAATILSNWMKTTGFPEGFPVSVNFHQENIDALKELRGLFTPSSGRGGNWPVLGGMLTGLLPIGPVPKWARDQNETSVEEVVAWMESSNNIFDYASLIKTNSDPWYNVQVLNHNLNVLGVVRDNYEKIAWYEEALGLVLKSNLMHLDTSDCPETEDQYNNVY